MSLEYKAVVFDLSFDNLILANVNYYDDFDFTLIDIFSNNEYVGKSYCVDSHLIDEMNIDFLMKFGFDLLQTLENMYYYLSFYIDNNGKEYFVFVFENESDFYRFLYAMYKKNLENNLKSEQNDKIYKLLEKHLEIFV